MTAEVVLIWFDIGLDCSYARSMELQFSAEQEAELTRMAHQSGKSADELAREVVARYLAEEARFRAGVQAGLDAAERGDFVPTSEVWATVERALKA